MQNKNMEDLRKEWEQLSTPQLDRILQDTLQQEGDPEEVQLILEVLKEREGDTPFKPDDTDQIAWQKYLSRMKKSKDKPGKKPNWILRAASVAAILCVLLVAVSNEAGWQHAGVVQHHAVSGTQEGGQIVEMLMPHLAGVLVQGHQAGGIPLFQRSLCNELLRQVKIKIRSFQCQIAFPINLRNRPHEFRGSRTQ